MKRYNRYSKRFVFLKKGEDFCDKCKGSGLVTRSRSKRNNIHGSTVNTLVCSKCLGSGKLDWLEKAVGKKSVFINFKIEKTMLVERERKLNGTWRIDSWE